MCPEIPLEEANANVQGSEKLVWGRGGDSDSVGVVPFGTCRGIRFDALPATQVC